MKSHLRWTCKGCGKQLDLPRDVKCPKLPEEISGIVEWKWFRGWLEHKCKRTRRWTRCRVESPSKRFLVIPGHFVHPITRQRTYVGSEAIMDLYGVRRCECVVAQPGWPLHGSLYRDLIPLRPDPSGRYRLQGANQEMMPL